MEKLKEIFYNHHMINTETFKKSREFLLLITLALIFFTGCATGKNNENRYIQQNINHLSLRQKIGQLFIIRPEAIDSSISLEILHSDNCPGITKLTSTMEDFFIQYPAGGFCIFDKNIQNPVQIKELNFQIHNLGSPSPLIFIDEEGGSVSRIASNKKFPVPKFNNMAEIGKTKNFDKAYNTGYEIGAYLKEYGFDIDFAPVADVNTNPKNPIIGTRAFSSDPEIAAKMDIAFLEGLHASNILGCLKHFPGHGDTKTDTHKGYAETLKTWKELKECELITFKAGIDSGVQMIMTAHISTPNITENSKPATLSYYLLTEKLRKELGFNGIIITDALEMGAIRKEYSSSEAAIQAIEAGADLILMPYDFKEAFEGLLNAVVQGRISEKRIDESVKRILQLKKQTFESPL